MEVLKLALLEKGKPTVYEIMRAARNTKPDWQTHFNIIIRSTPDGWVRVDIDEGEKHETLYYSKRAHAIAALVKRFANFLV